MKNTHTDWRKKKGGGEQRGMIMTKLKINKKLVIAGLVISLALMPFMRMAMHKAVRGMAIRLVWGAEGDYPDINSLTTEDFPVPVTEEFVRAYKLFLKMWLSKVDELGETIGEYTFEGDVLLPLQIVASKEMTAENEWEILVSHTLITIGYLSAGDIHNAYLEALKVFEKAKVATITKDDPRMVTFQTLIDDIHSETAGITEVMSAIDALYTNDEGTPAEFALLAEHPDADTFTILDKSTKIREGQVVQLKYPGELDEVHAPITFKGIVRDVNSTIMRYWIQYWTDVNGNMYADAEDTGSSWITVEEVEGPTKLMVEKIISSIDAGTKDMFLDNISYVCRVYSINEAGELSADPTVNYMSGNGNRAEALEGFDWQGFVQDRDLSAPPASPSTGDRYIVKATGTGAWAGHDNAIAEWNGSSWDFTVAVLNMALNVHDETFGGSPFAVYFDGSDWEKVLMWTADMVNAFTVKPGIKPPR